MEFCLCLQAQGTSAFVLSTGTKHCTERPLIRPNLPLIRGRLIESKKPFAHFNVLFTSDPLPLEAGKPARLYANLARSDALKDIARQRSAPGRRGSSAGVVKARSVGPPLAPDLAHDELQASGPSVRPIAAAQSRCGG